MTTIGTYTVFVVPFAVRAGRVPPREELLRVLKESRWLPPLGVVPSAAEPVIRPVIRLVPRAGEGKRR